MAKNSRNSLASAIYETIAARQIYRLLLWGYCLLTLTIVGFRPRFADFERPPFIIGAIDCANGSFALGVVGHFHKTEAPRFSAKAIDDYLHRRDLSVAFEQLAQAIFGRLKSQISNVNVHLNLQIKPVIIS